MTGARPSVARQAARVRDMAARANDPAIAADLEAAAETLDYHARHPALMKACAYFLQSPDVAAVFKDFPDAKFAGYGKQGEFSSNGK